MGARDTCNIIVGKMMEETRGGRRGSQWKDDLKKQCMVG